MLALPHLAEGMLFSMEAAAATGARLEGIAAAATTGARMEEILLSMETWRPRIFFSMEAWSPWRRPWKQDLEVVQSTTCFSILARLER